MNSFKITALFTFIIFNTSYAIDWQVVGQDSNQPVYSGSFESDLSMSLGKVTLEVFMRNKIPFKGTEEGIESVLHTPTGIDATVVENAKRMRVYGWCYEVDGVQPSLMPEKYFFASQSAKLKWFYAFAIYDDGQWVQYCVPAHTLPLKK